MYMVAVSSYIYVGNKQSEEVIIATGIFMYHNIILQTFKPILQGMYKQEIELVVHPKLGMQG